MKNSQQWIEKDVPFRDSILWSLQRQAYQECGPKAWSEVGVPFYLTSNVFIASRHAQFFYYFLKDALLLPGDDKLCLDSPVYLLDLGAGSGRFAYLFLKSFLSLLRGDPQLSSLKFCYVATDIVSSNLDALESNSQLREYFDSGQLDTAFFDFESFEDLHLRFSGRVVKSEDLRNPLFVVASYYFDTIKQDLLSIKDKQVRQGLVSVQRSNECIEQNDKPVTAGIEASYRVGDVVDISQLCGNDCEYQFVLDHYLSEFTEATLVVPLGALETLKRLRDFSKGRFVLLASDQGTTELSQVSADFPEISHHQTFSVPVDYYFLGEYLRRVGGEYLLADWPKHRFISVPFILGYSLDCLPLTTNMFDCAVSSFESEDYWDLVNGVEESSNSFSLELLLSILRLGSWDSGVFYSLLSSLQSSWGKEKLSKELLDRFCLAFKNILKNHFLVNSEESFLGVRMGEFLVSSARYKEALECFHWSCAVNDQDVHAWMGLGICHCKLLQWDQAELIFQKVEVLDSSLAGQCRWLLLAR